MAILLQIGSAEAYIFIPSRSLAVMIFVRGWPIDQAQVQVGSARAELLRGLTGASTD